MKFQWFHDINLTKLRREMKHLRWLLIRGEDLSKATPAWMFAELDGCLIAVDHRHKPFKSGTYNRAIHLLLVNHDPNIKGITKVATEGELEDHLW
ncbi:MAG: hypothetical protein QGI21_06310 [Candidatus Poseidoniaceae archaeon]|jgi:hypothetical protein|nr:hypothetical protein [Candidatus Poseidoniaceae archaeon]